MLLLILILLLPQDFIVLLLQCYFIHSFAGGWKEGTEYPGPIYKRKVMLCLDSLYR